MDSKQFNIPQHQLSSLQPINKSIHSYPLDDTVDRIVPDVEYDDDNVYEGRATLNKQSIIPRGHHHSLERYGSLVSTNYELLDAFRWCFVL
ncbi:unnamed protein product [Schistosoma mattheei]|uniref:Uncharacterized protein n=1 Tax=Schistosoma mattheei TaxID=31246 RepID=A0A183Q8Q0_9TREM|nr:unnamed protein product [Schistosoma mattheei]